MWLKYNQETGEYQDPTKFKIGSVVKPYLKGSVPLEVIGHDGSFVVCRRPEWKEGTTVLYFPNEISHLVEETRDNIISKIIG